MTQNMFAAGYHRASSTTGIHLGNPDRVLPDPSCKVEGKEKSNKVFQALKKTEMRMSKNYGVTGVGTLLLPTFFPNGLRADEIVEWRDQQGAKYGWNNLLAKHTR